MCFTKTIAIIETLNIKTAQRWRMITLVWREWQVNSDMVINYFKSLWDKLTWNNRALYIIIIMSYLVSTPSLINPLPSPLILMFLLKVIYILAPLLTQHGKLGTKWLMTLQEPLYRLAMLASFTGTAWPPWWWWANQMSWRVVGRGGGTNSQKTAFQ